MLLSQTFTVLQCSVPILGTLYPSKPSLSFLDREARWRKEHYTMTPTPCQTTGPAAASLPFSHDVGIMLADLGRFSADALWPGTWREGTGWVAMVFGVSAGGWIPLPAGVFTAARRLSDKAYRACGPLEEERRSFHRQRRIPPERSQAPIPWQRSYSELAFLRDIAPTP